MSAETGIALLASLGIAIHLLLRYGLRLHSGWENVPLFAVLVAGGVPLVWGLLRKLLHLEFGSDLLAGMSIVTSVVLAQYLVASIVVLMLSGGAALEQLASQRASSVLDALTRRMPRVAHRRNGSGFEDVDASNIRVGDLLVIFPHELCPVDGVVKDGHGYMDESYLTGEPFLMQKTPGSLVISGSVNGEAALTIEAEKLAQDSRYARIMRVMEQSQQQRPKLRRLGDSLGAWYTPLALLVAVAGWIIGGTPDRFLAVLVVATPCPLLIAIPVAVIGAISLSARRGIIIRNPAILEQIQKCSTMIFDKTGTLTYGKPEVTAVECAEGVDEAAVIRLAASVELYSKHPLAQAIVEAARARQIATDSVEQVHEQPGYGITGQVGGVLIEILARKHAVALGADLPAQSGGLECAVFLSGVTQPCSDFTIRREPKARHSCRTLVLSTA